MVRSSHTKSHSATDERDVLYKEYPRTTKEFDKVWNEVSPTLNELLWRCERANGKHDLFKSGLEAFEAALKSLQANKAACDKADVAEEALRKARKPHGNHFDSKQASEVLEKAKQEAEKTAQDVETAIKAVETAHRTGLRRMKDLRSPSYKEVHNLKKYFEYTRYMLERKSTDNLVQAITYWERASKLQEVISTVYPKDKISRFQCEIGDLKDEICLLKVEYIPTVESKTQRIEKIKEESECFKLGFKDIVRVANDRLSDILLELKHFHGGVEFAEQKRVRERKKEEKYAQAKLGAEDVQKGTPHS